MNTKTERWTLRVTPTQDMIVRRVLATTGMSLNEYVVASAVSSATNDLADRQVFGLSPDAWEDLQHVLDRPTVDKPRIAALLKTPSVLEQR